MNLCPQCHLLLPSSPGYTAAPAADLCPGHVAMSVTTLPTLFSHSTSSVSLLEPNPQISIHLYNDVLSAFLERGKEIEQLQQRIAALEAQEQTETMAYLERVLDEDRLSDRPLFAPGHIDDEPLDMPPLSSESGVARVIDRGVAEPDFTYTFDDELMTQFVQRGDEIERLHAVIRDVIHSILARQATQDIFPFEVYLLKELQEAIGEKHDA